MRGVLRLRAPAAIAMVFALALNVVGASAAMAHWSLVTAPDIGGGSVLEGVSCTSTGFCMTAGNFGAERWNGTGSSVVGTPSGNSLYANEFRGISCTSATFCIGAGDYYDGSAWQTLIERWNGTKWALVPSPNAGRKDNYLAGVSCVSTAFCIAVGYYNKASARHTLVEQWNGTVWGLVSSPDASAKDALHAVTRTSTSFCVATGNSHTLSPGFGEQTLIESWTGAAWSVSSPPNSSPTEDLLDDVGCVGITFCMSVGQSIPDTTAHTLIEKYSS